MGLPRLVRSGPIIILEYGVKDFRNLLYTVAYAFAPVIPDIPELAYNLDEALLQPGLPGKSRVRA